MERIETVAEPIIGRYYLAQVVKAVCFGKVDLWPIIGTWHEDAEYIMLPDHHYHLDTRFLTRRQLQHIGPFRKRTAEVNAMGLAITDVIGRPTHAPRKFKRPTPPHPLLRERERTNFENAYATHKLKNMICPHRGLSLIGQPVRDGCVTCPLHGLKWNVESGELVRTVKVANA